MINHIKRGFKNMVKFIDESNPYLNRIKNIQYVLKEHEEKVKREEALIEAVKSLEKRLKNIESRLP